MTKTSKHSDPRRSIARQHTARLRELLRTPAVAVQPSTAASDARVPESQGIDQARTLHREPVSAVPPRPVSPAAGILPLKPIQQCLRRPRSRAAQLVSKTQRLVEINRILKAFLPPQFNEHVVLASLDTKAWRVHTDSSAWATRLRYLLPTLRQHLGEHLGIEIPPLRVRISPPTIPSQAGQPARRMVVTEVTAATLEQAAGNVTDNRLGSAMRRLAEHARQRSRQD